MNLSYSNSKVIKAEDVILIGKKTLKNHIKKPLIEETEDKSIEIEEALINAEEEIKLKLIEAERRYEEIIASAKEESLKIVEESKNEALNIEKKAYEQGHSQGLKNGYEDGYKEAYEENIEKAKLEASEIIKNADKTLFEAREYVLNYMKENKKNIINLSISIAEQVLREKFTDVSSMDNMIMNIIEEYELKENFVIKVNPLYKENLDKQILDLKQNYKVKGDVFVLEDDSIEQGNAVIDNLNGRLVVGIDTVLDRIKEELL